MTSSTHENHVTGYRRWQLIPTRNGFKLTSLYSSMIWHPNKPAVFYCGWKHSVPTTVGKRHNCGISIAVSEEALKLQRSMRSQVEGLAEIWGDIIQDGLTIRGSQGRPTAFYIDGLSTDAINFLKRWDVELLRRQ